MAMSALYSTNLFAFPSEVIGHICQNLAGEDICRLLLIGSPTLYAKLRSPHGAYSFVLNEFYSRNLKDMTPLVQFQSLKTLKVIADLSLDSLSWITSHTLEALPPTLTAIEFRFIRAETCWIHQHECPDPYGHHFYDSDEEDSMSQSGSVEGEEGEGSGKGEVEEVEEVEEKIFHPHLTEPTICPPMSHCYHFSKHLPSLKSLILQGAPQQVRGFRDCDIQLLPATLTELELSGNDSLSEYGLSLLPPNLEVLHLPKQSEWDEHDGGAIEKRNLPLRSLIVESLDSGLTAESHGLFPPTLEAISICTGNYYSQLTSPPNLPPLLTDLSWPSHITMGVEDVVLLPRHLLHLRLGMVQSLEIIDHLPKGLKSLAIGSFALFEEPTGPIPFPPGLTELSVDVDLFHNLEHPVLPPNLTKLKCRWPFLERFIPLSERSSGQDTIPKASIELPPQVLVNDSRLRRWFRAPTNLKKAPLPSDFKGFVTVPEAISSGNLELLVWLSATGHDMRLQERRTAYVHLALDFGHMDVAKWLIRQGIHPMMTNSSDYDILAWLARHGKVEFLKQIVSEFSVFRDLLASYFSSSEHPNATQRLFQSIVESQSFTLLQWLSEAGFGKSISNASRTHFPDLLAFALRKTRSLTYVRELIENFGCTVPSSAMIAVAQFDPLTATKHETPLDFFRYLSSKGGPLDATDERGWSLAHYAAISPHHGISLLQWLADSGAPLTLKTHTGHSPYELAAVRNLSDNATLLRSLIKS